MGKILFRIVTLIFIANAMFVPVTVWAGNPPDQSKSTITGTYAPADGSTPSSVTVNLRDSSNNAITSSDTILITSSDSSTSFNPSSVTLDGSGVFYTQMKTTHVGYTSIIVNDKTTNTQISGNIYFYTPGGIPPSSGSCLDSPPGSTAQLVSATATGDNSITLTWTDASNPVTYYLVSYGTASGNYTYGNPNIGGQGTTTYTIGGLTVGTKYYFVIRAGNGCTPGAYSNELSAVAGGTPTPTATPTLTTTLTPIPTISQTITPRTPTATPTTTQIHTTPAPTPPVTLAPVPIETIPSPTSQPENSSLRTIMIIVTIAGILIFAGVGVWLYIEWKKQNKPPPITY